PPCSTLFPYTTLFRSSKRLLPGVQVRDQIGHLPCRKLRPLDALRFHQLEHGRAVAPESGHHCNRGERSQAAGKTGSAARRIVVRSEEHTSELQSLAYL